MSMIKSGLKGIPVIFYIRCFTNGCLAVVSEVCNL